MYFQDAQAYLLEQDGKLLDAFKLMKTDLEDQISQLISENSPLLMSKLNTTVILIIQLCQRSSLVNDISENQRDKMWFDLLDSLMKPQNNELKSLIKHVLTSSMGHISLHSVVDKILREPGYQSDNLGKDFLRYGWSIDNYCTFRNYQVEQVFS